MGARIAGSPCAWPTQTAPTAPPRPRARRAANRTAKRDPKGSAASAAPDYRPTGTDARTGFFPTLKRTVSEFREDGMMDWAAALTYYGLLALFPAMIALVSVVGVFGDPVTTTRKLTDIVTVGRAEHRGGDVLRPDQIDHLESRHGRAPVLRRPRRRAVVGLRLHRRVHARIERRLRDARGPPVLEAAAAAAARHARDGRAAGTARALARADRPRRRPGRRTARRQRRRHHRVGHREVAGDARGRDPDDRGALPRLART